MASRRSNNGNKWLARRKRDEVEYILGWFKTKEEALEAERGFDSVWPRKTNKGLRREISAGGKIYFA